MFCNSNKFVFNLQYIQYKLTTENYFCTSVLTTAVKQNEAYKLQIAPEIVKTGIVCFGFPVKTKK